MHWLFRDTRESRAIYCDLISMKKRKPRIRLKLILSWFRLGMDTSQIAYLLRTDEAHVANTLHLAREAERAENLDAIPTQHKQTVEGQ